MQQGIIALPDVLTQMEQTDRSGRPIPFSLKFISCDERRQVGGDIMEFKKATLCFPTKSGTRKFNFSRSVQNIQALSKQGKAPSHVANGTINISTEGNILTKVSIWLITHFNNKKVAWHIHG